MDNNIPEIQELIKQFSKVVDLYFLLFTVKAICDKYADKQSKSINREASFDPKKILSQ